MVVTMDRATLAMMARKHWAEWLPQKTEDLKESGSLNEEIQAAAAAAQKWIQELMASGYQEHEAAEMALARYILLKPEESEDDWESRELAEMEAEYQEMMREPEDPDDPES